LQQQANIQRGVVRGLEDIPEGAAQMAERLGVPGTAGANAYLAAREAEYNRNFPGGRSPSIDLPRTFGNLVAGAPIAYLMPGSTAENLGARVASGVASGAVSGALQPVSPSAPDYWTQKTEQAGVGALSGAAGPIAGSAAARGISPAASVNPDLKLMRSIGATPSIGQTLGGVASTIEQKLSYLPFGVGDFIAGARARGVESFNRGLVNRALAPIGETLNPQTPVGNQAIAEMHDKIGAAYNSVLPNLTFRADPTFLQNISAIRTAHLTADAKQQLGDFLRQELVDKLGPGNTMSGRTFKDVDSVIGQQARSFSNAGDPNQRNYGQVLQKVQTEMRAALARSNPTYADTLDNINSAYAGSLRVQGAASSQGAKNGVFTPAQFSAAVRSLDPSLRKGAFGRGEAYMQDLSSAGRNVLGDTIPNSGTPGRLLTSVPIALLAGEHIPGGQYAMPLIAAAGGIGAAYTRPGQAVLRGLTSARPAAAAPVASVVRRAAQATAPATGPAISRYFAGE
jgi:hypothetical protein